MSSRPRTAIITFATGFSMLAALACSEDTAGGTSLDGEPGSPRPESPDNDPPSGDSDTPTEPTGGSSTGDDPTTGSATTSSSSDETTSESEFCGDGIVGADEACDDGEANSDLAYCTELCTLNICGDGLLLAGVELCDHGSDNSDLYGHTCDEQCHPGKWCGDNLVQPEEQCDQGPGNGGDDTDEQGLKCSEKCNLLAYRGFITDTMFTGDLGGLDGADEKCRDAALAAGLATPEKFRAALSTGDVSLNTRFADKLGDATPYISLGGLKIAGSFADLIAHGPGDFGVATTEYGVPVTYGVMATNTKPDGTSHGFAESCGGWDSASKDASGLTGYNALPLDDADWETWKSESWWVNAKVRTCDSELFRIYCLE